MKCDSLHCFTIIATLYKLTLLCVMIESSIRDYNDALFCIQRYYDSIQIGKYEICPNRMRVRRDRLYTNCKPAKYKLSFDGIRCKRIGVESCMFDQFGNAFDFVEVPYSVWDSIMNKANSCYDIIHRIVEEQPKNEASFLDGSICYYSESGWYFINQIKHFDDSTDRYTSQIDFNNKYGVPEFEYRRGRFIDYYYCYKPSFEMKKDVFDSIKQQIKQSTVEIREILEQEYETRK